MEITKVSAIDYGRGLIKVELPAKDNMVSDWITFPAGEYEMPEVGDLVRVEFEPTRYQNPYTSGICLGRCFNRGTLPKLQGKDTYYKEMLGDVTLIYDRAKKQLTIQTEKEILLQGVEKLQLKAQQIRLEGQQLQLEGETIQLTGKLLVNGAVSITGETAIQGNLTVSGTVSAANI